MFSIYYDVPHDPPYDLTLELSARDSELTERGELRVASSSSSDVFHIYLAVPFGEMTYPFCFQDEIIVIDDGKRVVAAPPATVCINDAEDVEKIVYLPIEGSG